MHDPVAVLDNFFDLPDPLTVHTNQYELVIFALETGEVALLQDVELIGWGEVEAP
jgi:hypothetical protein